MSEQDRKKLSEFLGDIENYYGNDEDMSQKDNPFQINEIDNARYSWLSKNIKNDVLFTLDSKN